MKKYKEMFTKRMQIVAILALALIAIMITLVNPAAGATTLIAFAVIVGGIELTGKEEALYNAFTEHINKEVGKFEKGYITEQKMLDSIAAKMKDFNLKIEDNEEFKKLSKALEAQGLELVALKEKGKSQTSKMTALEAIQKGFDSEDVKKNVLDVVSRKAGVAEIVTIKAVGNITTGSVTTTTGGNALLDLMNTMGAEIARLATTFIENFATVMSTTTPVVTYADYIPKEGDANFTTEGVTKTQLDGKIEVRYATPKKAGAYEILTDESVQDVAQMKSFATTLLFKKYLLRRQHGILFGDGIGENPTGVTTIASAFSAASWTGTKIVEPNLLDVLRAVANQIYTTVSWTDDVAYMPNVAYINPSDWFAFIGTKSSEGMYVFPQLTFGDSNSIDNFTVIANAKIPSGKILMGDFSKLVIVDYISYAVKQGYINEQLITGLMTMVGEGRFFTYVKEYDKRAFVYDDIANVVTGIKLV